MNTQPCYFRLIKDDEDLSSLNFKDLTSFKADLLEKLEQCEIVSIDLKGVRSLSPSFAYEMFGQLYSDVNKLKNLEDRFVFINDPLLLSTQIIKAIQRRIQVLLSA